VQQQKNVKKFHRKTRSIRMADAITVGNDIGLWSANTPEEMQKYWLKNETGSLWHCDEKLLLSHDVPQHRKETCQWKCTTRFIPHQNHNGEVVDRSWLCLSFPYWKRNFRLKARSWPPEEPRAINGTYTVDATITCSRRCN